MNEEYQDEIIMILKTLESVETYEKLATLGPGLHASFLQKFGSAVLQIIAQKPLPPLFSRSVQQQPLQAVANLYGWLPYAAQLSDIANPFELLYSSNTGSTTILHLLQMLLCRIIMEQLIPMSILHEYPTIQHWFQKPTSVPVQQQQPWTHTVIQESPASSRHEYKERIRPTKRDHSRSPCRMMMKTKSRSRSPIESRTPVKQQKIRRNHHNVLIETDHFDPDIRPLCLFSLLHKTCVVEFDEHHSQQFEHLTQHEKRDKLLVDTLHRYCLYSNRYYWMKGLEPCMHCSQGNCKYKRAAFGRCSKTHLLYIMIL